MARTLADALTRAKGLIKVDWHQPGCFSTARCALYDNLPKEGQELLVQWIMREKKQAKAKGITKLYKNHLPSLEQLEKKLGKTI